MSNLCNTNPTDPSCECPKLGSFNIQKVKIPANAFGPNNPPNDRYFCSQSTSMCQRNPTINNCACNSNSTYHDCQCPSGEKYLIPFGSYAHFGRDYIYCCGDKSGAFDNICRQVGWRPSSVEKILPDERAVTTAAPKAIVTSTAEGQSFLGTTSDQVVDVIKDITQQTDQNDVVDPAQVDVEQIDIAPTEPEPTKNDSSRIVSGTNGTLAVSSQAENTPSGENIGQETQTNATGVVDSTNNNTTNMADDYNGTVDASYYGDSQNDGFPLHILVPIIVGLLFLIIAIFLIWRFTK